MQGKEENLCLVIKKQNQIQEKIEKETTKFSRKARSARKRITVRITASKTKTKCRSKKKETKTKRTKANSNKT